MCIRDSIKDFQVSTEFHNYKNLRDTLKNDILNLPKGTEHFLADIHGEYAVSYTHLMGGGSVLALKYTGSSKPAMAHVDHIFQRQYRATSHHSQNSNSRRNLSNRHTLP